MQQEQKQGCPSHYCTVVHLSSNQKARGHMETIPSQNGPCTNISCTKLRTKTLIQLNSRIRPCSGHPPTTQFSLETTRCETWIHHVVPQKAIRCNHGSIIHCTRVAQPERHQPLLPSTLQRPINAKSLGTTTTTTTTSLCCLQTGIAAKRCQSTCCTRLERTVTVLLQ